jgi:LCP family protein required for cell wall assembly
MKKMRIFQVIIGFALVGLLLVGVLSVQAYHQPLADPLTVKLSAADALKAAQAKLQTTDGACNAGGSTVILALGRDNSQWRPPYGADAVRLVKVNFDEQKVTTFSFPRDLVISTPSLTAKYGLTQSKLGSVYDVVREKENGSDLAATNAVAQTLYDNFGISSDHYVTLDETILSKLVDTVGGIEVDVPAAVLSADSNLPLNVNSGEQIFNGDTTIKYVRYTSGPSTQDEWGRLQRQEMVLEGLMEKIAEPSVYGKIPELFQQFKQDVTTDLSTDQIVSLACVIKGLTPDKVSSAGLTSSMVTIGSDAGMEILDLGAVKQLLNDTFAK